MENKSKFIRDLLDDLAQETYFGLNLQLSMYDEDEEVLILIRNLVDRAKKSREN